MQNVNLYYHFKAPPPVTSLLTFTRAIYILIVIFAIFILIYLYSLWNIQYLTNERDNLHGQAIALKNKFYTTKNSFPPEFFRQDAQQAVKQLQEAIAEEQKIYQNMHARTAFSSFLMAFGNAIVENVWLTEIDVTKGGEEILLHGQSLNQNAIQQFMNSLGLIPIFSDYHLNVQDIEAKNQNDNQQNTYFEISLVKKT